MLIAQPQGAARVEPRVAPTGEDSGGGEAGEGTGSGSRAQAGSTQGSGRYRW